VKKIVPLLALALFAACGWPVVKDETVKEMMRERLANDPPPNAFAAAAVPTLLMPLARAKFDEAGLDLQAATVVCVWVLRPLDMCTVN
jgi:hypothetical protein